MRQRSKLRHPRGVFAALCLALIPATSAHASAAAELIPADAEFVPGELVVQFEPSISKGESATIAAQLGASVDERLMRVPGAAVVGLPPDLDVERAVTRFEALDGVSLAGPNFVYHLQETPDDPRFITNSLWGLQNLGGAPFFGVPDADIDATEAWDLEKGDPSVRVAVIDSGIDTGHPDLASNIWVNAAEVPGNSTDDDLNNFVDDVNGWDFVNNDADPADDNSHGTHVAGTLGAVGDNGIGATGVNWDVSLMALKAGDEEGDLLTTDVIEAITYARLNGASIVNASFSGDGTGDPNLTAAIQNSPGVLFVAAAGNGGDDNLGDNNDTAPEFPCTTNAPNLLCVAATNAADNKQAFSNFGRVTVDLAAPGVGTISTVPGNTTLFTEDFEMPDFGTQWQTGGTNNTWDSALGTPFGGLRSLQDSPLVAYADGTDSFARIATPIDLTPGLLTVPDSGCELEASVAHDLAAGDQLTIEGSTDGVSWTVISSFTGVGSSTGPKYPLDPFFTGAQQLYLRLHLVTDAAATADGVQVDDLAVTCAKYGSKSGTSMSTPHVAGTAALLLAANPSYGVADLRAAILNNVDQRSSLTCLVVTGGRLNAHRALQNGALAPSEPETCPTPTSVTPVLPQPETEKKKGCKRKKTKAARKKCRLKKKRG